MDLSHPDQVFWATFCGKASICRVRFPGISLGFWSANNKELKNALFSIQLSLRPNLMPTKDWETCDRPVMDSISSGALIHIYLSDRWYKHDIAPDHIVDSCVHIVCEIFWLWLKLTSGISGKLHPWIDLIDWKIDEGFHSVSEHWLNSTDWNPR